MTAQEVWNLTESGKVILIDPRPYKDYEEQHPKHAVSFSFLRIRELQRRFPDKSRPYILLDYGYAHVEDFLREFKAQKYNDARLLEMQPQGDRGFGDPRNEWEQKGLPYEGWKRISYKRLQLLIRDYDVIRDSLGYWKRLARFVVPTAAQLLKYRPEVKEHFGYSNRGSLFEDIISCVTSANSIAVLRRDTLWVGFSFYEGEGSEGYGGVGFCDLSSGSIGILRHPALINHSARSLVVTDTALIVATVDNFELISTVGNGVVIIDRRNAVATAIVPPGTDVLWDKDSDESVGDYYEKSIPEMLDDKQFVPKPVEQFDKQEILKIGKLGLEKYMIETFEEERRLRSNLFSHAVCLYDSVIVLDPATDGKKSLDTQPVIIKGYTYVCSDDKFAGAYVDVYEGWEDGHIKIRPIRRIPQWEFDFSEPLLPEKGFVWYCEGGTSSASVEFKEIQIENVNKDANCPFQQKTFDVITHLKVRVTFVSLKPCNQR